MQDERRITWNCVQTFSTYLRLVVGRFTLYKSGNVEAGPFLRVPPNQFFPFAPRTAIWPRTGAVVDDAAITRPREAPAVTEIVIGLARVGFVYAVAAKHSRVNPAAGRSRTVGF